MKYFLFICIFFGFILSLKGQTQDTTENQNQSIENDLPDYRCDYSFLFNFDCIDTNQIKQQLQTEVTEDSNTRNLAIIEKSLQSKDAEIRTKQTLLDKKEKEIRGIELRIERKINELQKLLNRDQAERIRIEKLNKAKFDSLVELYSRTEPENAANFINGLEVKTAASIIIRLKPRIAAAIFDELDQQRAVAITKHISELQIEKANEDSETN